MSTIENGKFLIGFVVDARDNDWKTPDGRSGKNPSLTIRLVEDMPTLVLQQKASDKMVKDFPLLAADVPKTRTITPGSEVDVSTTKLTPFKPGACVLVSQPNCEVQAYANKETGVIMTPARLVVKSPDQVLPICDKAHTALKITMSKLMSGSTVPRPATFEGKDKDLMGGVIKMSPTDAFETTSQFKDDLLYKIAFTCTIGDVEAHVSAYELEEEFGFENKPVTGKANTNPMRGIPAYPGIAGSWSAWMRLFMCGLNPIVEGSFSADKTLATEGAGMPLVILNRARFSRPTTESFSKIGVELDLANVLGALQFLEKDGPDPRPMKKSLIYIVTGQNEDLEGALSAAKGARFFMLPKPSGLRAVTSTGDMGLAKLIEQCASLPVELRAATLSKLVGNSDSYLTTLMIAVVREIPPSDPAAYTAMSASVKTCYSDKRKREGGDESSSKK